MNEREKQILHIIINHIQRDQDNRINALGTYIEGKDIVEPFLKLSMVDYRKLCRLANVLDTLTMNIEDIPVIGGK